MFRFLEYLPIRNQVKQEAILRRLRSRNRRFVFGNQQGQAVVEYVLLLVIIVSLILGLRGVFGSMNDYMSNVMGEYIACLMEYGELPSLGVQESDLKNHQGGGGKRCSVPNFSATAALASSGAGGANSQNGSTNGVDKNGPSDKNASNNSNNESNKNESSSSSGSSANRGRRSSPYNNGQISRSGGFSTADNPQSLNSKSKVKSLDETEEVGFGQGGRNYSSNPQRVIYRGRYRVVTGAMADEIEKNAGMTPRQPSSKLLGTAEEGYRITASKRNINPPEYKEPVDTKKDEEFSFGNFLKWLIIAGIIIACFILFGGQVLNYSNSDN